MNGEQDEKPVSIKLNSWLARKYKSFFWESRLAKERKKKISDFPPTKIEDFVDIKMVLKSKKHVFWEALIITIVIFLAGLFLGMLLEAGNSAKISNLYLQSEISLTDAATTARLSEDITLSCETIKEQNIEVANRIYEEAKLLELYEDSGKLTDSMEYLHKKYDLLRTLLWISNDKVIERCENYNLVVYLYEYNSEDNEVKAMQNVWSKILLDIKEQSHDFVLIPIAANQNLTSLEFLKEKYEIEKLPSLVINNEHVLYELDNAKSVLDLLN